MPAASKPSSEESSSESSERLMAAREKRQASRNRLREMKAAAKRAREGEKAVVTDLPSPKKTKGEKGDPCVCVCVCMCVNECVSVSV